MARSHLIVAPLTTAEGVHRLADAIGGDVTPRTDVHNASLGRYLRRTPPAANLIAMRAGGGAAPDPRSSGGLIHACSLFSFFALQNRQQKGKNEISAFTSKQTKNSEGVQALGERQAAESSRMAAEI